jgi:hypothetical protein
VGDYRDEVLGDNPIGYWRLDETSGTTAADASGNGHNGAYQNGVTLGAAGALANDSDAAARFDGVNDSVRVSDNAALRLNGSWSIEFWAKQNQFVNTWPGILRKGQSSGASGYIIWADSSGQLWYKRNNQEIGSGGGALTSSFRYFVVTYDGSRVRWYVNGVLRTTTAVSYPTNTGTRSFRIGRGDDYGNNVIDEVALYDTPLSAVQIAAHYLAGS